MSATARTRAAQATRALVLGWVGLDALAREAGLHPDVVRRLAALGLLDAPGRAVPPAGAFPRDAARRLVRAVRLRRDLGLNYAGAMLASDLLDRIDELEARLRSYESANRVMRR
jgi:MerR HTH family regulatory protein